MTAATSTEVESKEISGKELDRKIQVLTNREMDMIRAACNSLGVVRYLINPKSQSLDILMGVLDQEKQQWNDGILPQIMRTASKGRVDLR